jgi:hypothetical protein
LNISPSWSNVMTLAETEMPALALDLHPVGPGAAVLAAARTWPGRPDRARRPAAGSRQVVLPASGWEMIAKVRRRAASAAGDVLMGGG